MFTNLIEKGDLVGIGNAITKPEVEKQVLLRLREKAKTYGSDPSDTSGKPPKVDVNEVVKMYEEYVIPLTKEVEVEYLMQRLKEE